MNRRTFLLAVLCFVLPFPALAADPRPLKPEDIFALKTVSDPQISPDGRWVAFSVRSLDPKADRADTDVWMVPFEGGDALRLTTSPKSESSPRFSPDGRYLAFLSAREGEKTQVWLLDRRGGEAAKLTDYKADVSDLAWSPDGTRLALVVGDPDPDEQEAPEEKEGGEGEAAKTPKPIVIRRLQFKRDGQGYLRELRDHLHVFDVKTRKSEQITRGAFDDAEPAWSPDGEWIAFTSNRSTPDPDATDNSDVFVIRAKAGETPKALTTALSADLAPAWSPDGKTVAYVAGGDPKDIWYATNHIAVVPAAGGEPRALTRSLDRNVDAPTFTPDGRAILFLLEDGGNVHLARVPAAGGTPGGIERVLTGEREIQRFDVGPKGELVVLETSVHQPAEVSAVTSAGGAPGEQLRRLTRVNDEFLKGIRLGKVERFQATSPDGTRVDAFLTRPPGARAGGVRLPTILRIHGGPTAQYSTAFNTEWQMFAAQGYAVVGANPRGSTGYGRDFSYAIWADWGNKDYEDVVAAVDQAIAMGVADPDRLGVGGWSYGGILTNYVITKTKRFKAATSGASEVNYLANYGTDHYQREWEGELGLPWENTDLWIRMSPFFQVKNVTTPTLILCGADDVNVPLLNSEQLYQAFRRLGLDTELVIYPGQSHAITKPSYQKDRLERYFAWYDKYLKVGKKAEAKAP
jgi:dipeptidyl aminopeptidase/acylaminoacyl peptidase